MTCHLDYHLNGRPTTWQQTRAPPTPLEADVPYSGLRKRGLLHGHSRQHATKTQCRSSCKDPPISTPTYLPTCITCIYINYITHLLAHLHPHQLHLLHPPPAHPTHLLPYCPRHDPPAPPPTHFRRTTHAAAAPASAGGLPLPRLLPR